MGRILSQDVPIFAGFRHLFAGAKPFNYTIYAVVNDASVTAAVEALVRDVLADTEDEHPGILFSVPVSGFANFSA